MKKLNELCIRIHAALHSKKAEVYLDKAVWIMIVVAVGLMLLPAIEAMWGPAATDGTILNQIKTSITSIFSKNQLPAGG